MSEKSKRTVAIDLDGVLAEYNGWKGLDHIGTPFAGAVEFVASLLRDFEVIVHTCRTNPDIDHGKHNEDEQKLAWRIANWLKENRFPEGVKVWTGSGKPIAAVYLDDRAIHVEPANAIDKRTYFAEIAREVRLASLGR